MSTTAGKLELLTNMINSGLIGPKEFYKLLMSNTINSNPPSSAPLILQLNPGDLLEILVDRPDSANLRIGDIVEFIHYSGDDCCVENKKDGFRWYLNTNDYGKHYRLSYAQPNANLINIVTGTVPYITLPNISNGSGTFTTITPDIMQIDLNNNSPIIASKECTCPTLLAGHHDNCPYPKRNG